MSSEWTLFGYNVLIGMSAVGAAASLVLWAYASFSFRGSPRSGFLHASTIVLVITTFVVIDLVLLVALVFPNASRTVIRMMIAFAFGLQTVAAISAIALIKQSKKRRRSTDVDN